MSYSQDLAQARCCLRPAWCNLTSRLQYCSSLMKYLAQALYNSYCSGAVTPLVWGGQSRGWVIAECGRCMCSGFRLGGRHCRTACHDVHVIDRSRVSCGLSRASSGLPILGRAPHWVFLVVVLLLFRWQNQPAQGSCNQHGC